jgi:dipeptidyl aminopeptidase/acylaminoacyl peptidase
MAATAFDDVDTYIALPRVSGLTVSPDGTRVVVTIAELNVKRTEYISAIWELDPAGVTPARRLTRGANGESSPVFTSDGDLLFLSVHPRVDAARTAAMGGSFGGYMANWVAGHTDRFKAIITHASLWALDQFGATTDSSYYWLREMTPQMALENSPHRHVGAINTPMLVIHGDKDYRVPIGEALRLWFELLTGSGLPADANGASPHRFLYFPSENHWVLAPQHAKIWYQVVAAFLAEHVLGQRGDWPEALG